MRVCAGRVSGDQQNVAAAACSAVRSPMPRSCSPAARPAHANSGRAFPTLRRHAGGQLQVGSSAGRQHRLAAAARPESTQLPVHVSGQSDVLHYGHAVQVQFIGNPTRLYALQRADVLRSHPCTATLCTAVYTTVLLLAPTIYHVPPSCYHLTTELGAGHFLGHWLSATAMAYENTGDVAVKAAADKMVALLSEVQQAFGATANETGFIFPYGVASFQTL